MKITSTWDSSVQAQRVPHDCTLLEHPLLQGSLAQMSPHMQIRKKKNLWHSEECLQLQTCHISLLIGICEKLSLLFWGCGEQERENVTF